MTDCSPGKVKGLQADFANHAPSAGALQQRQLCPVVAMPASWQAGPVRLGWNRRSLSWMRPRPAAPQNTFVSKLILIKFISCKHHKHAYEHAARTTSLLLVCSYSCFTPTRATCSIALSTASPPYPSRRAVRFLEGVESEQEQRAAESESVELAPANAVDSERQDTIFRQWGDLSRVEQLRLSSEQPHTSRSFCLLCA